MNIMFIMKSLIEEWMNGQTFQGLKWLNSSNCIDLQTEEIIEDF